jgi:drug/metabolite transporter (DMT)-like permease
MLGWLGWAMGIVLLLVLVSLLRRLDASHVGALLLLVPAVTAIASVPVLGQPLHPLSLLGMAVAMVGVRTVIVRRAPRDRAGTRSPGHGQSGAEPSRA